ncbi:MAG: hypothetical protein KDJ74_07485 [Notoacmeibacter sp.]|nr:hypothetical protein [Notoacmeibacter sp.]
MPDNEINESETKHLIVLIHGINTRAKWLYYTKEILEKEGFIVEFAGYGVFSVAQFLLPFNYFRNKAIDRVRSRINSAVKIHKPSYTSIIAHSFGSFVAAKLICSDEIKFHRVVFCGSVISIDHPFHSHLDKFTSPIVNEVASKDIWPAVAESITWGYGSIGSYGFVGAPLKERFHPGIGHSGYFSEDFCKKYWVPFFKKGDIINNSIYEESSIFARIISSLRIKYILMTYIILGILNFSGITTGLANSHYRDKLIIGSEFEENIVYNACQRWMIDNLENAELFDYIEFAYGEKYYDINIRVDENEKVIEQKKFIGIKCRAFFATGPLVPLKKLYNLMKLKPEVEMYCTKETKTFMPSQTCSGLSK